jgi:sugar/nucleoside kinase (ribokinase family)
VVVEVLVAPADEIRVVDSVGAGDTFNAAFIAAVLGNGAGLAEALAAAVHTATQKCTER